jgi:hypothetical protein
MPDVGGPYLIDTAYYGDWSGNWYGWTSFPGAFEYAGALYMAIWSSYVVPPGIWPSDFLGFAKSLDDGVTWAPFGAYNVDNYNTHALWISPEQSAPNKIRVAFRDNAPADREIAEFDLDTGVWTVLFDSIRINDFWYGYAYDAVNGVDWVFYNPLYNTDSLWAVPYVGGVEGLPVEVVPMGPLGNNCICVQVRADPINGRLHVVYRRRPALPLGVDRDYYYCQVKPDGTVTAPIYLGRQYNIAQVGQVNRVVNHIGFTSTEVVIPWMQYTGPLMNDVLPAVWALTALTDDVPSLVTYRDQIQTLFRVVDVSVSMQAPDGSVTVWWATIEDIATSTFAPTMRYKTFKAGVFGPEVMFHDELAFPTTPPPGTVYDDLTIFGLTQPLKIASGFWTTSTALFLDIGDVQCFWVGYAPPVPPPVVPVAPYAGGWPSSPSGVCRKTTLHLWQAARAPQVEISTDRRSDWTECGDARNKFFQGFLLDADTYGAPKFLQVRDSDTGGLHVIQPASVQHAGRKQLPYSFETPFLAHQVRDEPLDVVPWRRFGISYIWEPSPEKVRTWHTQRTAHGLQGYQHVSRIEAAYESSASVTLTLTSFDGISPVPLTLPSTGGVYQKLLLTLTPNKGQLYEYDAVSGAAFRLFLNDWVVWVGQWGRPGPYIAYRNLGGEFGDKAEI